ncbi:MAG: DUF3536 domain-containing protein, partial [Gemmatimonadota bacterium]
MPARTPSLVLHGHFYQPPREDPWTGRVPREPSAAPHHDWNERITAECYRPITHARLPDAPDGSARALDALEWMSFDVGPTLLQWLERAAPDMYERILEADRRSRSRANGHGNAIAHPYHHVILPLASPRDRRTEVRWGIADFERRFGRRPGGMWLPETAVDLDTLDSLAAEGIAFTVLAPHQLEMRPPAGEPARIRTSGGREIAVFTYDGGLSHGVAFGELLRDAAVWERHIESAAEGRSLVALATDGETYGHHREFGELALAALIERVRTAGRLRLDNFASFLVRHPARHESRLVAPSSWSCAHGIERWRSDCGCRLGPLVGPGQAWRRPLRDALEWLAAGLHALYEEEGRRLFGDPWRVRDAYGRVLEAGEAAREAFVARALAAGERPTDAASHQAGRLLEIERDALRLFTSCAWFFDDLARLEPLQVLR